MPSFEAGVFRRGTTTAHRTNDRFKKVDPAGQLRQLAGVQLLHSGCQLLDASGSAGGENPLSFVRRADSREASVVQVADPLDETVLLQSRHDSRHGRRLHLLRRRQLAEGERAAEDDYGESGKTRGRKPARIIFPAELAEEMNG